MDYGIGDPAEGWSYLSSVEVEEAAGIAVIVIWVDVCRTGYTR